MKIRSPALILVAPMVEQFGSCMPLWIRRICSIGTPSEQERLVLRSRMVDVSGAAAGIRRLVSVRTTNLTLGGTSVTG